MNIRGLFACVCVALCSLLAVGPAQGAASARLTVDDIVSNDPVTGKPPFAFTWAPDGSRYVYSVPGATEKSAPVLRVHDMRTGSDRELFAAKSEQRGSRSRAIAQIAWSDDGRELAFLNDGKLEMAGADGARETTIARDADDPQFSPDGKRVAYVHANDLYVVDLRTRAKTRLTTSGSATRINGDPDWLYSEEMDVAHAYAWSPDGRSIAFLSFDESPIVPFPIQDYLPTQNYVEYQRYPLAGAKNPRVQLRLVDARTAASRTLYDGGPRDEYLVSFTWTPDSRSVVDEILDRAQQHVRLTAFDRDGEKSRTILRESNPHFVDVQQPPIFLRGGLSFLWLSERDNVQALYRVSYPGGTARRLSGSYPVGGILAVDERRGDAYVSAFAPTRRDYTLIRIPLGGGASHIVTPGSGAHTIRMAREGGSAFIETFSSFARPPVIRRVSLHGTASVTLFQTPSLARFNLGTTRRLEIPSRWGMLDAQLTVPADFDPSKRYPVIVTAYGGPLSVDDGLPSNDRWQGLYTFLLAQHGFLVFTVDGPASNNDRASNARLFSGRMGEIAMQGQLAGVAWLKQQPYVEASRLGLFGWSYGGYLTALTLTHAPGLFRTGIAGAPPADWRFYDSAYTERYMGMPQHERVAYEDTSVLPDAHRLESSLLILQGSSDDNVHLMNSISLQEAFIKAGKQVQYFVYPGARHGVRGIQAVRNLDTRMLDWWERTLR